MEVVRALPDFLFPKIVNDSDDQYTSWMGKYSSHQVLPNTAHKHPLVEIKDENENVLRSRAEGA